jgi:hypothetical protein
MKAVVCDTYVIDYTRDETEQKTGNVVLTVS